MTDDQVQNYIIENLSPAYYLDRFDSLAGAPVPLMLNLRGIVEKL